VGVDHALRDLLGTPVHTATPPGAELRQEYAVSWSSVFHAVDTDNRGARFTSSQCDCCDLWVIITVTYLKPHASGRLETRRGRLEPDDLFDRIEDAHASSDGSLAIGRCSFDSDTARALAVWLANVQLERGG